MLGRAEGRRTEKKLFALLLLHAFCFYGKLLPPGFTAGWGFRMAPVIGREEQSAQETTGVFGALKPYSEGSVDKWNRPDEQTTRRETVTG